MAKCLAALTKPGAGYPGYINFTRYDDGSVSITVRADPDVRENSIHICGDPARDKGAPGRCTPGDDRCNNYCNLAPQKGPMQPSPLPCVRVYEGKAAVLKLSIDEFSRLLGELKP